MSAKIVVLYPQPTDVDEFERAYVGHGQMVFDKLSMVSNLVVSRPAPGRDTPAPYYLIAEVHFNNADDMKATLRSPGMREVGGDANRISTGGAPIVLICGDVQETTP